MGVTPGPSLPPTVQRIPTLRSEADDLEAELELLVAGTTPELLAERQAEEDAADRARDHATNSGSESSLNASAMRR